MDAPHLVTSGGGLPHGADVLTELRDRARRQAPPDLAQSVALQAGAQPVEAADVVVGVADDVGGAVALLQQPLVDQDVHGVADGGAADTQLLGQLSLRRALASLQLAGYNGAADGSRRVLPEKVAVERLHGLRFS